MPHLVHLSLPETTKQKRLTVVENPENDDALSWNELQPVIIPPFLILKEKFYTKFDELPQKLMLVYCIILAYIRPYIECNGQYHAAKRGEGNKEISHISPPRIRKCDQSSTSKIHAEKIYSVKAA